MRAAAISLKGVLMPALGQAVGRRQLMARDMRERRRYNADDAEVGGHGSGHQRLEA